MCGETTSLLPSRDTNSISDNLKKISSTQPCGFQRKIRGLSELSYFKGSEFRVFILYSGPFVLKDILPSHKYNHFLLLHVAILILTHTTLCQTQTALATSMIREFVTGFAEIYGKHHITYKYNMHCLIHLGEDVEQFGNLDNYSAFEFESYMCVI